MQAIVNIAEKSYNKNWRKKHIGQHELLKRTKVMEKQHQKLLSIIIPIYNVENYLEECLNSIHMQLTGRHSNVEVILIDDGSCDNSGRIADTFAETDPSFGVIHKANEGVAAARNTGIDKASGEWLYFVDSDDWLAEDAVESICSGIKENANADIIIFDAYKYYSDKTVSGKKISWEHFKNEKIISEISEIRSLQREVLYFHKTPLAAPWDKVYRRSFLMSNNIVYREELKVLDDMVFNVEAFGAAKLAVYRKDKIYYYRYVADSITNSYKPDRIEQDMKVWNYLKGYMDRLFLRQDWNQNDREKLIQAYFCRVVKSFTISRMRCWTDKGSESTVKNKVAELKRILSIGLYKEAFSNVKLKELDWKLKVIVIMARLNMGYGIYLIYRLYCRIGLRYK